MTRPLIGIDPGLTGAIVLLTHDGVDYEVQEAHFMPTVPKRNGKREVSGSLLAGMLRDLDQDAAVFIELVNAMPAIPSSSERACSDRDLVLVRWAFGGYSEESIL